MTKVPFDPFAIYGGREVEVAEPATFGPDEFGGDVTIPSPRRLHNQPPIAVVYWAEDGGPVRTILDGRKSRPTGTFPSIKAGFRSMPWDSFLEEQVMQMADISSRVSYVLAQPHRIEIMVRKNRGKPLVYFPDLLLLVHPSFLADLLNGMTFSDAAAVPFAQPLAEHELVTLIVEVKADVDPRDGEEGYQDKLDFAKEVYSRRGFHFFELRESAHLKPWFVRLARLMDFRKKVVINDHDEDVCLEVFNGGTKSVRWRLEEALGSGPLGRAKLHGLHYRQFVSIDFTRGIIADAPVWLRTNEGK